MLGWFVGRGEDDPHGHLLRVSTAYNRYMGHAFSARDISAAKVPSLLHEVAIETLLIVAARCCCCWVDARSTRRQ